MPNRFGHQPARQALFDQRWSIARAATEIGVPVSHLGNCVYGKIVPSPGVRERLPRLLGVPLEELFTAEALAEEYDINRGPRAGQRSGADWAVSS